MKIKTYTINDFKNIVNSGSFWNDNIIPITKHRIISHIHNPRANDNDLALIVMYDEEDNIIAYRGLLPDTIYFDRPYRMAWLSAFWVAPKHRRKGIGSKLMSIASENYDSILGSSRFSISSGSVYKNSKQFIILKELKGVNYFFKSNIYAKQEVHKIIKPFIFLFDFMLTGFSLTRQKIWSNSHNINKILDIEYIFELDTETTEFVEKLLGNNLLKRSATELNWILKFPWVLNAPLKDKFDDLYYFSSVSKEMKYINFKLFDKNKKVIAFVMLKVREGVLSIPYIYFKEKYSDKIAEIIVFHMIQLNISNAHIYNDTINNSLSRLSIPTFRTRKIFKSSVISKKFEKESLENYTLQDGDGDCVFT